MLSVESSISYDKLQRFVIDKLKVKVLTDRIKQTLELTDMGRSLSYRLLYQFYWYYIELNDIYCQWMV